MLSRVLYYTLWPVITLMTWFMEGLRWLFTQTYGTDHKNPLQQPLLPTPTATPDNQDPVSLPGWFAWLLRIVIGVPLVAALLAGTALLFSRMRRREGADEVRESSYEDGRLGEDLGGMLSGLFGGLRRGRHGDAGLDAARRLYYDVLDAGASARWSAKIPRRRWSSRRAWTGPSARRRRRASPRCSRTCATAASPRRHRPSRSCAKTGTTQALGPS